MDHSPPTRPSLLVRIRDPRDRLAWGEFVELYGPLVHAYARSRELQDADAADVAQDVLAAVATHAERFDYDPARGTFRGWLFRITLNKLRDLVNRRSGQAVGTGETQMQAQLANAPDRADDEAAWNQHYAWQLFLWGAQQARVDFRDKTWQAFWRTSVEQHDVAQVAKELDMTAGAVHIARCRVLARVKELLQNVEQP